jgi:hypothetical protein
MIPLQSDRQTCLQTLHNVPRDQWRGVGRDSKTPSLRLEKHLTFSVKQEDKAPVFFLFLSPGYIKPAQPELRESVGNRELGVEWPGCHSQSCHTLLCDFGVDHTAYLGTRFLAVEVTRWTGAEMANSSDVIGLRQVTDQ